MGKDVQGTRTTYTNNNIYYYNSIIQGNWSTECEEGEAVGRGKEIVERQVMKSHYLEGCRCFFIEGY